MKSTPSIRIWLFSRAEIVAVGDAVLAAFAEDSQLAPQHLGRFEPYDIDLQSVAARELWRSEAIQSIGLLGGERKKPVRIGLTVSFGMTPMRPFHTLYWTADKKVLNKRGARDRIAALFRRLVAAFDPYWGAAFHSDDFESQNVLRDFRHPDGSIEPYHIAGVDLRAGLPGLYWLNFFGKVLCDFIGMQNILRAVPSAEAVGNGLLVQVGQSPTDLLDETLRERRRRLRIAIGEDLFFDIHHPERPTRAPAIPIQPPLPTPPPPHVPSIRDPVAFIRSAPSRASLWRLEHGVGTDITATLHTLEVELDALGLRSPDEEAFIEYVSVLGQLVIERAGGHWVADREPHVVTSDGLAVYPASQILKRAVDHDASLVDWLDATVWSKSVRDEN